MRSVVQVVAALALLVGPGAFAQVGSRDPTSRESPRSGMIELKLGNYRPLIDAEPGLTGDVYSTFFGAGNMLLGEVQVERQFYQGIGTASVGISVGYAEKYGRARREDGTESGEVTSLRVVPLRLLGVYRFDWAAQHHGVPLVPYGKLGVVGIPFFIGKGSRLDEYAGRTGSGTRFGYQATAGLAFQLDVLGRRMAKDLDSSLGINHSYIFAEYTLANMFGRGLNLGHRDWSFGLGLEY